MQSVRIFKPAKTAMQSGKAKTKDWVLEFLSEEPSFKDPLMLWTAGYDTQKQVRLKFKNCEDAVAYAQKKGWTCVIHTPQLSVIKAKSYADNFKYKS